MDKFLDQIPTVDSTKPVKKGRPRKPRLPETQPDSDKPKVKKSTSKSTKKDNPINQISNSVIDATSQVSSQASNEASKEANEASTESLEPPPPLNPASKEQLDIINKIKDYNIIVDSVAGSGKTTTNLHLAKTHSDKNILLLTYNSRLKMETREKVKTQRITNLEVHSYHSFCVKYYNPKCFTDKTIIKILEKKQNNYKPFTYDIIILDEAQDINDIYCELVFKIIYDNGCEVDKNRVIHQKKKPTDLKDVKICLLGDKFQSIYEFSGADNRYLVFADKLFNVTGHPWVRCKLSTSYRITNQMSDFLNYCMLDYQRIRANKNGKTKVRYVICNTFMEKGRESAIYKEVKHYLKLGINLSDIFILAPSIRNKDSPVVNLANMLSKYDKIPIYAPSSDEEKIDDDVAKGKLVFATFHQTKGLERKVVIIFNFDNSYFLYYNRDGDPDVCANTLYVACTRAKEYLTVLHSHTSDYLPFLQKSKIPKYAEIIKEEQSLKISASGDRPFNDSVINICRNMSALTASKIISKLQINKVRPKAELINLPAKFQQGEGMENVSDISNMAIIAYYELMEKNMIGIQQELWNIRSTDVWNDSRMENIKITKDMKLNEILYIANLWMSYLLGYVHRINQIKDYSWMTDELMSQCQARIKSLNLTSQFSFQEKLKRNSHDGEMYRRNISGFIDCIDEYNLYQFKTTSQIENEHILQLMLNMFLHTCRIINKFENDQKSNTFIDIVFTDFTINQPLEVPCRIEFQDEKTKKIKQGLIIKANNGNYKVSVTNMENQIYFVNSSQIQKIITRNVKPELLTEMQKYHYYLYNIQTNEMLELKASYNQLFDLVEYLLFMKYYDFNKILDNEFMEKSITLKNKYFIDS